KRTSWNEFSSAMASALICLSTEEEVQIPAQDDVVQENVIEQVATDVGTSQTATDVAPPTSPLPPSPIIPSTPPHQSPSPPQ
nr:hypothetical protein [Tanacetum cinerariifolium]